MSDETMEVKTLKRELGKAVAMLSYYFEEVSLPEIEKDVAAFVADHSDLHKAYLDATATAPDDAGAK